MPGIPKKGSELLISQVVSKTFSKTNESVCHICHSVESWGHLLSVLNRLSAFRNPLGADLNLGVSEPWGRFTKMFKRTVASARPNNESPTTMPTLDGLPPSQGGGSVGSDCRNLRRCQDHGAAACIVGQKTKNSNACMSAVHMCLCAVHLHATCRG